MVSVTVLTREQGSGGKKREALIPRKDKTRASGPPMECSPQEATIL
jgi:hypothetical protein